VGQSKRVIQVFIADSSGLFRSGLTALFSDERGLRVIGEAATAAEITSNGSENLANVLIVDVGLLDSQGQQAVFALRQANPSLAILVLTREDGPEQLQIAISAGARAYMLKDSTPARIVTAVRDLANGSDEMSPSGLSPLVPDLQALAKSNEGYVRGTALTAREQEVMKLLAEGRTVREVAAELSLSIKTIEAHKLNLMRKLDIHNRATLVEYAVQRGVIPAALAQR
jgi:two-component system response regulator NreC